MWTRAALRAPPLRLPALRALPPLMLMMRPQPAVFMKGMTAREQRSAPTYFVLKSCSKSSSTTVSIGPVAVAEPPGADPLLTRMCRPPSCCAASATMRSTCSLLVTSAARGTMRRFVSAASSRAVASRSPLFRATIPPPPPLGSQFPRNGFANAPTAASHDRMLALQSEVHGTLSPCCVTAILTLLSELFSLREPGAGVARRRTMYGTCLHCLRQSRRRSSTIHGRTPSQSCGSGAPGPNRRKCPKADRHEGDRDRLSRVGNGHSG